MAVDISLRLTRVRIDGGVGGVEPPTSTFQTHYFSKNIDLIDEKTLLNPPPPPTSPFDNSTTAFN